MESGRRARTEMESRARAGCQEMISGRLVRVMMKNMMKMTKSQVF